MRACWRLLVTALLTALACDRSPAPERRSTAGSALRASCAGLGPAACDRPPSTSAVLCQSLAGCVRDPSGNFNFASMTVECNGERSESAGQTAFTQTEPAPPASGVRATSFLDVVAGEDGAMQLGASYLVAELPEGRCIVDAVLSWAGSHSDTELSARWDTSAESPARLHVRAHRTTFTVLEQEELARGESNVMSEICARRSYAVAGGRFTLVEHSEAPGTCAVAP